MKHCTFFAFLLFTFLIMHAHQSYAQDACALSSLQSNAINNGFDESTLEVLDSGTTVLYGRVFLFSKLSDYSGMKETYYMDCQTGDIYDHRPSFSDILPEASELKVTSDLWEEIQNNPNGKFEVVIFKDISVPPSSDEARSQLESHGLNIISVSELEASGSVMFVAVADVSQISEISKLSWVKDGIMTNSRYALQSFSGAGGFGLSAVVVILMGVLTSFVSLRLGRKLLIAGLIIIVAGVLLLGLDFYSSAQRAVFSFGPGCICDPLSHSSILDECTYDAGQLKPPVTFGSYDRMLVSKLRFTDCDESQMSQLRGDVYIDEDGNNVECMCIW